MKQEQFNSTTGQAGQNSGVNAWQVLANLKILARNSWFLLGNVLLLIGGDDSVELCLASPSLQLTNQNSRTLSTIIAKDSSA
jgi:hypothetical protein